MKHVRGAKSLEHYNLHEVRKQDQWREEYGRRSPNTLISRQEIRTIQIGAYEIISFQAAAQRKANGEAGIANQKPISS